MGNPLIPGWANLDFSVALEEGPRHPQVPVHHPLWDEDVLIDAELAPLMKALWARQIDTLASCQDNVPRGYAWIQFADGTSAELFLDMVAGEYHDTYLNMHRRILGHTDADDRCDGRWFYAAHVENAGFHYEDRMESHEEVEHFVRDGPNDLRISISIRFPWQDLAKVLWRVRHAPVPTPEMEDIDP